MRGIIEAIDVDGDGHITIDEFLHAVAAGALDASGLKVTTGRLVGLKSYRVQVECGTSHQSEEERGFAVTTVVASHIRRGRVMMDRSVCLRRGSGGLERRLPFFSTERSRWDRRRVRS